MNEGNTGDNMIKSAKFTIVIHLPTTSFYHGICLCVILNVIQRWSIFSYQHDMAVAKLKLQGTVYGHK